MKQIELSADVRLPYTAPTAELWMLPRIHNLLESFSETSEYSDYQDVEDVIDLGSGVQY